VNPQHIKDYHHYQNRMLERQKQKIFKQGEYIIINHNMEADPEVKHH
jgi:hypothetical protein